MKVIVVSHGHPKLRKGGGEIVAYNQFIELRNRLGKNNVNFFAACDDARLFGDNERIINYDQQEYLFQNKSENQIYNTTDLIWVESLKKYVEKFKPNVIHFHHYYKVGLELIRILKNIEGLDLKVVLTLHEFLAICQNDGQMIKSNGAPCLSSSSIDCTLCGQHRTLQNTFLREIQFKNIFSNIDEFISPSNFLMERYIDWGIPKNKISHIPNGIRKTEITENYNNIIEKNRSIKFGFFGQFTPYKGIDIFCEAALILKNNTNIKVDFVVYGDSQQKMSDDFTGKINYLKNKSEGIVNFMGGYDENYVVSLMQSVDWVVIPSRWWENSPVVVDEARLAGTPMLVSNHGGLKEKVVDLNIGYGFMPGSASALANLMMKVVNSPNYHLEVKNMIQKPLSIEYAIDKVMELY